MYAVAPPKARPRIEDGTVLDRRRAMHRTIATLLATALSFALVLPAGLASALEAGGRQPEIGLTDLRGSRIDLASLKGKVVIIDFWASWCAPCKEEMPVLERLYKKYKDRGFVVVGISVDQELANVRSFLKQLPVSFPIVHDADHKVADRFKPPRMPSSYVVDRKGIVRYVHAGFRSEDGAKLEAEVQALLGK
jgi:thiol-disulfide isomerase/thioredoxin